MSKGAKVREPSRRGKASGEKASPTASAARLQFALADLQRAGALAGVRSQRLSARVDPGLVAAARKRTGLSGDSDLVNAALAVIAAGDGFGAWLVAQAGTLPADFELAL